MLKELSVEKFIETLASKEPTPGGGSVSALSAAMGAGLLEMVCSLSLSHKDLQEYSSIYTELLAKIKVLREKLIKLIDADATAFDQVILAFKMPKESEEEKQKRSQAIQAGYKGAIEVPLQTVECCHELLALGTVLSKKFNVNAASDVAVALECLKTGIKGAMLNVFINLGLVKDEDYRAKIKSYHQILEDKVKAYAEQIKTNML